jgi:AcrR family transcriptional regulator
MPDKSTKRTVRREPKQARARQTVEAVLEAAVRILKREGIDALTTNRIAEVAGVSIGSLYQYFPHKESIFEALHRRHIEEIDRLIHAQLTRHASSSLEILIRTMIEAMIEAHTIDPELSGLLATEVPHSAGGTEDFAVRLHGAFRLAIASKGHYGKQARDLDKTVFVVANMVDALSHGAALRRPANVSLSEAKAEAVRAVMAYLKSSPVAQIDGGAAKTGL